MKLFGLNIGKKSDAYANSDALAAMFGNTYGTDAGVSITPSNAMEIITVFSCVKVLAESVGMLPLNLMKEEKVSRSTATEHSLQELLRHGPNDFMTSQEYKELITSHLALRGNHYSFINRTGSRVTELLPLNPSAVTPKLNNDWSVEYNVTFANGEQGTFTNEEIFHVRLFGNDGLTGLSPIQQARHGVGLAKVTERHANKVFANGAHPSGGFTTDTNLKAEQKEYLRDQLEGYKGDGAHKNLILDGGLKWFQATMSAVDTQFLETRKFQRSEICGLFRVPPHMIADLEKSTFSNIEQQGQEFVSNTLMPYLTRIEQRIAKDLLSPADRRNHFAKFNANALLRGDMKARAEFYTKLLQNGALSPNEIREFEDMNHREGGDIYLTPLNMAINGKEQEKTDEA